MTAPEIGCALSHRDVAQIVAASGKRTLILEDDVALIGPVPIHAPDFSLAYLGYETMNMKTPFSVKRKLAFYYPFLRKVESVRSIYARSLNDTWLHAGWFNGAYAYILTLAAAAYIVELQERI
jgi:hypothetical protein